MMEHSTTRWSSEPTGWRRRTRCSARAGSPGRGSTSPRTCCAGATTAEALVRVDRARARSATHLRASSAMRSRDSPGALRGAGVGRGRPRRRLLPNMPEAVVAMLAAASLGALWSSCSPDFGAAGRARPLRPDRAEGARRGRRLRAMPASASTAWSASATFLPELPSVERVGRRAAPARDDARRGRTRRCRTARSRWARRTRARRTARR